MFMTSNALIVRWIVLAVALLPQVAFSYDAHVYSEPAQSPFYPDSVYGGQLVKTRIIGDNERTTEFEQEEKDAVFGIMGRVWYGNAVLLDDCRTVVTAAHVSQDKKTGRLKENGKYFDVMGSTSHRLRLNDRISAAGKRGRDIEFFFKVDDWNVLRLEEEQEACVGATPAYFDKEALRGKELYSFSLTLPEGAKMEDKPDYIPSVHRKCRLIDPDDLVLKDEVEEYEREGLLLYTCDSENTNSGHGIFVESDGMLYLIGIHLGIEPDFCVNGEQTDSTNSAEACPNIGKWIEGNFMRSIEASIKRDMKKFESQAFEM